MCKHKEGNSGSERVTSTRHRVCSRSGKEAHRFIIIVILIFFSHLSVVMSELVRVCFNIHMRIYIASS